MVMFMFAITPFNFSITTDWLVVVLVGMSLLFRIRRWVSLLEPAAMPTITVMEIVGINRRSPGVIWHFTGVC